MTSIKPQSQPPSQIRFVVVFVTFLAALLLYLHRFCLSYTQRYVKEDLGLTDDHLGYCFSAFFFAYALGQVPSGWLSDRFGARRMLTVYILVWSFFTALMGLTMGFVMLLAIRMAVGLGQAGAYPTSASLLGKWVPFSSRGQANSVVAFGGRVGGGIAPILTVTMVVWFVSLDVPSRLTSQDMLDVHYLSYQMLEATREETVAESENETPRKKQERQMRSQVLARFSDASKQTIRDFASSYEQALSHRPETKKSKQGKYEPEVKSDLDVSSQSLDVIVGDLNVMLDAKNLFNPEQFSEIPIEKQAKSLAKRDALSPDENVRLNRLLLESVFPDAIRKVYVQGWRKVMFVYGSLGLIVAGLFWFCFRDRPANHPWCNREEVKLIEEGQPASAPSQHGKVRAVPMKQILASKSLWLMCINQWGSNIGWVFLVTWLPRYLLEEHSVPFIERGWMAAIPLWVGWGGMLTGGWLTDRVTGRFGLRWRTLPIAFGRYMAMLAYLSCLFLPTAWAVTAAFAVVAFSNDLCNPASWSYKQDVGGQYVGSIHGWANMWGNLGATVSPILLQFVISRYSWDAAFITCAAAFFISGTAALGVDARIPIAPPDETD